MVSVYYRPRSGTTSPNEYACIPKLLYEANGTQTIIGGNFIAKHGIWGYATADSRGRILADELESLPLHICNTVGVHTRAGLHAKQADTTPDLTIAIPKVVKRWITHPTTWGSDPLFSPSIRRFANNANLIALSTGPTSERASG
ncbi:hypothetical protein HPB49_010465 [Dermacentor silvarum]|uniref:Uncharacterized protein n=1 Tax=Dermacentor silvarum TaxID=543639 RepID=A0ACB8D493_DERSI|nr:hypothetical protein HPB49_010465 [Dermacentor silvarum]